MVNTTDDPRKDAPETKDGAEVAAEIGVTDQTGTGEDHGGSPEVSDDATEETRGDAPANAEPDPISAPVEPDTEDPAAPSGATVTDGSDTAASTAWMPEAPDPEPFDQTLFAPVSDSVEPCEAGLFGKLPARGDFIARALDRDLMRALEDWLLPLVQGTRDVLGQGWATAWGQAPAWRFWIGPGVLAGEWQHDFRGHARKASGAITGVLLPSADKQGRLFPLAVILADSHARLMPPPVLAPPDRTFYAACDALLHGARDGRDLAAVESDLAALAAPRRTQMAEAMEDLLVQQSLWAQTTTHDAEGNSGVWADIRASDHQLAAANRSYWWVEVAGAPDTSGPTSVLSLAGLPDPETFAFMLTDAVPRPPESEKP